jgi:hypothetical protein
MDWWNKDAQKLLRVIREDKDEVDRLFPDVDQKEESLTFIASLLMSVNKQLRTIRRICFCILLVLIFILFNIRSLIDYI